MNMWSHRFAAYSSIILLLDLSALASIANVAGMFTLAFVSGRKLPTLGSFSTPLAALNA